MVDAVPSSAEGHRNPLLTRTADHPITLPLQHAACGMTDTRRTVCVVIPAFNEEAGIGLLLDALKAGLSDRVADLVVVDDGSTDRTSDMCKAAGIRVIRHASNRGYGASLKTGIRAATSDFVLTMDADGQHRIEDALALIALAELEQPDLVIGQRTELMHSPLWRMPGKWLLTWMAQYLTKRRIPDLNSGLRVVRREVALRYLHLCPQGFSFSTTITMALISRGHQVLYQPIEVQQRSGKSTVRVSTGIETIILVLRLAALFNPLRIFLPLSAAFILGGVLWGLPYALMREGVTVGAMMSIVTGVLVFGLGLLCDQVSQLRLERYD
jgi:glycosyltransferase involved in cell wall biosynthesis